MRKPEKRRILAAGSVMHMGCSGGSGTGAQTAAVCRRSGWSPSAAAAAAGWTHMARWGRCSSSNSPRAPQAGGIVRTGALNSAGERTSRTSACCRDPPHLPCARRGRRCSSPWRRAWAALPPAGRRCAARRLARRWRGCRSLRSWRRRCWRSGCLCSACVLPAHVVNRRACSRRSRTLDPPSGWRFCVNTSGCSVRARCGVASVSVQLALPALDVQWDVGLACGSSAREAEAEAVAVLSAPSGAPVPREAAQSLVVVLSSRCSLPSRAKRFPDGSLGGIGRSATNAFLGSHTAVGALKVKSQSMS